MPQSQLNHIIKHPNEEYNTVCNDMFWYAVYVKSRHEFRVSERLDCTGIEVFLPSVEKLRKWKDRRKMVTFPLFPGYLFVRIPKDYDRIISVLKTPGIVSFVCAKGGIPASVPDSQIISLKTVLENSTDVDPYPYLKEGNKVRIKKGSMKGVEGILLQRRGHHILVLSVDVLQQGASLKIDACDVEPL